METKWSMALGVLLLFFVFLVDLLVTSMRGMTLNSPLGDHLKVLSILINVVWVANAIGIVIYKGTERS